MKILTASVLISVIMALTAALPEESKKDDQTAETDLAKRWFWSKKCSSGWKLYAGRCFRYIPYRRTWVRAEKYCQALGGNLASVHSILEYSKIQRMILAHTGSFKAAWIGGSNAQEVRTWLWSDGTSFNYRNWAYGQPNNFHNRQRCLQMNFIVHRLWNDYGCFQSLPFVCAKKP